MVSALALVKFFKWAIKIPICKVDTLLNSMKNANVFNWIVCSILPITHRYNLVILSGLIADNFTIASALNKVYLQWS